LLCQAKLPPTDEQSYAASLLQFAHILSRNVNFSLAGGLSPLRVGFSCHSSSNTGNSNYSMLNLKTVSGRLRELFRGRAQAVVKNEVEPGSQNLLVVDDEESICFSMSEYFSQHGFKVDTAREMEEAEGLIKETDYKVIIQDLRLGVARQPDGIEIIKLVHKRNPDTRIVVLTSYGSPETEAEARRAGADAFLRKPKPLSHVAQVVHGLIESPRNAQPAHRGAL